MSRPTAVEAVDNCGVRSCRLDSRGWPAGEWHKSGRMRAVGWNAEWDLVRKGRTMVGRVVERSSLPGSLTLALDKESTLRYRPIAVSICHYCLGDASDISET